MLLEGLPTKEQAGHREPRREGGGALRDQPAASCWHRRVRRRGQERLWELARAAAVGEVSPAGALEERPGQCQPRGQQGGNRNIHSSGLPSPLSSGCPAVFAWLSPTRSQRAGRGGRSAIRASQGAEGTETPSTLSAADRAQSVADLAGPIPFPQCSGRPLCCA